MTPELTQLRAIHLPGTVSIWPLAPISALILCGMITICLYLCYHTYSKYTHFETPKQFALKKLDALNKMPHSVDKLTALATLLKQVALHYYSDLNLAKCHGQSWINFLNTCGKQKNIFSNSDAYLLTDLMYQKDAQIESDQMDQLIENIGTWMKQN